MICYKITINGKSNKNKNGGDNGGIKRVLGMHSYTDQLVLEKMLVELKDFLQYLCSTDKDRCNDQDDIYNVKFLETNLTDKNKKKKLILDILNKDDFIPTDITSTNNMSNDVTPQVMKELLDYIKDTENKNKTIFEPLDLQSQLTISLAQELDNGKQKNFKYHKLNNFGYIIDKIITQKTYASIIVENIIKNLSNNPLFKEQLTQKQIDSIVKILKNEGIGGLTGAITTIKSSALNGAVSLGNWIAPDVPTYDDDGNEMTRRNEQKIHFYWYPKSHNNYKKGSNESRDATQNTKYGDFMIIIDPETFANTGEFFKENFNSVEDVLTTMLNAYPQEGEVKRTPYKMHHFNIVDNTPQKDYEAKKTSSPVATM